MKTFQLFAVAGLVALAAAQEAGPSPTESVGCEPHGDHWHCEGPRPTDVAASTSEVAVTTTVAATTEAEHDHEDDHDHEETVTPGPSPTDSIGCEPHGDHW